MYISGLYPMEVLPTQGFVNIYSTLQGQAQREIPSPGTSAMAPTQSLAALPLQKGKSLYQHGVGPY